MNNVLTKKELEEILDPLCTGRESCPTCRVKRSHESLRIQLHVWKSYGPEIESATNEYLLEKKVEELRTQVIMLKIELGKVPQ